MTRYINLHFTFLLSGAVVSLRDAPLGPISVSDGTE